MRPDEIKGLLEKSGIGRDPRGRAFIEEFPTMLAAEPEMSEERFITLLTEKLEIEKEMKIRIEQAKSKADKLREALGLKNV